MLVVSALKFNYANQKPLFNQLHFSLEPGKLLHLKGKNGAGKTTLLRILAGLITPESGTIAYDNLLLNNNIQAYQQRICYIGHKLGLDPLLTVDEIVRFYFASNEAAIEQALHLLLLKPFKKTPCYLLSQGQLQKLALLRLFLTNAPLWLLDEPLVALDEKAIVILSERLNQHLAQGGQIVLTAHQALPQNLSPTDVLTL